jgi:hypothetical protein
MLPLFLSFILSLSPGLLGVSLLARSDECLPRPGQAIVCDEADSSLMAIYEKRQLLAAGRRGLVCRLRPAGFCP